MLKHVEKDKKLRKKAKEDGVTKEFLNEKKTASQLAVQQKLKDLRRERDDNNEKLREKFDNIVERGQNYDSSIVDFMTAKREQNEYK